MTDEAANIVRVEQVDREAAGALSVLRDHGDMLRAGVHDAHPFVQAFARHRLAGLSDRATDQTGVRTNQQHFDALGTPLRDRPGHTPECSRFETHSPWACDCHVRASADREGDPVLISREEDDDCGCPEERWEAFGLDIHMHLSDLGSNAHADGGDWGEAEIDVRASTHDLTRAAIFGWAKALVQPEAPARQPIADPAGEGLTCDFARALPSGGMDDSTFEAVEAALDRSGVPCTNGNRFLTLAERIGFLDKCADDADATIATLTARLTRAEGDMDALREAGKSIIARMFGTYKARNGRDVGIQGDDGEKCWIVHSDDIEGLRAALATPGNQVAGA